MPRTRQYYDPIIQAPSSVEGEQDLSRVEIYMDADLKWWGREVLSDGSLSGQAVSAFQHQDVIGAANRRWPELMVYELRNESDDSTWEGTGPSPRLWQGSSPGDADGASREPPPMGPLPDPVGTRLGPGDDISTPIREAVAEQYRNSTPEERKQMWAEASRLPAAAFEDIPPAGELHVLPIAEPGTYVRISDVLALLYLWESQYEEEKNPSAAMALREARETIATSLQGGRDG